MFYICCYKMLIMKGIKNCLDGLNEKFRELLFKHAYYSCDAEAFLITAKMVYEIENTTEAEFIKNWNLD